MVLEQLREDDPRFFNPYSYVPKDDKVLEFVSGLVFYVYDDEQTDCCGTIGLSLVKRKIFVTPDISYRQHLYVIHRQRTIIELTGTDDADETGEIAWAMKERGSKAKYLYKRNSIPKEYIRLCRKYPEVLRIDSFRNRINSKPANKCCAVVVRLDNRLVPEEKYIPIVRLALVREKQMPEIQGV